jgi:hypothetical protein
MKNYILEQRERGALGRRWEIVVVFFFYEEIVVVGCKWLKDLKQVKTL